MCFWLKEQNSKIKKCVSDAEKGAEIKAVIGMLFRFIGKGMSSDSR